MFHAAASLSEDPTACGMINDENPPVSEGTLKMLLPVPTTCLREAGISPSTSPEQLEGAE